MATFAFEAVDSKGQKVKKEVDASDREEAMTKIKGMGLYPTKVKEKADDKGGGGAAVEAAKPQGEPKSKVFAIGRVKLRLLTTFTQQLSTLQDAGLPIVRSLRIL